MHARHASSGQANPIYDGTSPRRAQSYLCRLWGKATRQLKHKGIDAFGVRVVEPHHDATPHWHMLVFVAPARADALIDTLRGYALCDSPNEPGAAEHRFTVERIDPNKGSAAGYVAKYVAKNIDAHGVEQDDEAERPAQQTARRVVAWSHLWGARQFQFFGTGALTPFRELRRLDRVPDALEAVLGDLWRAAKGEEDRSDFAAYMRARDAQRVRLSILYDHRPGSRYPGEDAKRLRGIVIHGEAGQTPVETRFEDWQIQLRPEAVEQRRATAKRLSEAVRGGAKRPSLGLASITPRTVDMTEFFRLSNTPGTLSDRALNDAPGAPGIQRARAVRSIGGKHPGGRVRRRAGQVLQGGAAA